MRLLYDLRPRSMRFLKCLVTIMVLSGVLIQSPFAAGIKERFAGSSALNYKVYFNGVS